MNICPICHVNLSREQNQLGVFWACASCGGRSGTVSMLRRGLTRDTVNALWQKARSEDAPKKRECPACFARMAEVTLPSTLSAQTIDVCTRCQTVWFDMHEFERMPALPPPPKTFMQSLPPEARERFAMLELKAAQERRNAEAQMPDETWKYIPALFGLPFEHTSRVKSRKPLVTWCLTAAITAVSLVAFLDASEVFRHFALVPATLLNSFGLTLITSVFLHGGFLHLFSNMYFLMVFGDDVEDRLGKARYALMFLTTALAGGIVHTLSNFSDTTPCVGASGAISGIITYYALAFPHARLGWMVRWHTIIRWFNLSARTMFIVWFMLQVFGAWQQIKGFSDVSALAHLGGIATGALFWAIGVWRNRANPLQLRVPNF